jgi:hypothetical protein
VVKIVKGVANVLFYESTFQAATPYPLKLSTILDSGTTLHIFNDLSRFHNFRKAPRHECVTAGSSEVPILGYGDVNLRVTRPNGSKGTLRLKRSHFVRTSTPILCLSTSFNKGGITGTTKDLTTSWPEKMIPSCARWRNYMGRTSWNMSH